MRVEITMRQHTAVEKLLEAALDERKPSKGLVKALNRALREFDHECAYPNAQTRELFRMAGI